MPCIEKAAPDRFRLLKIQQSPSTEDETKLILRLPRLILGQSLRLSVKNSGFRQGFPSVAILSYPLTKIVGLNQSSAVSYLYHSKFSINYISVPVLFPFLKNV